MLSNQTFDGTHWLPYVVFPYYGS